MATAALFVPLVRLRIAASGGEGQLLILALPHRFDAAQALEYGLVDSVVASRKASLAGDLPSTVARIRAAVAGSR